MLEDSYYNKDTIQYNTIQYSLFKEGDVITQWVIYLTAFTTIQNTYIKTMPNQ